MGTGISLDMKNNNVLLIGPPFLYRLVDKKLLEQYRITPIYSYKVGSHVTTSSKEHTVFYDELSTTALAKVVEQTKPDAIVCYNDNFLIEVAQLRDRFDIRGIGNNQIQKFKIKSQMYHVLKDIIPTPNTIAIDSSTTSNLIRATLGDGEYFIKPNDLAGSEGTTHISSVESLNHWLNQNDTKKSQYLIQKYYDLPLVHCELYIQQGDVRYIQARRYSYPNHLFLQGKTITSLPIEDSNLRKKIESSTKQVAKALSYMNGVMHVEFFLDKDESLIFLETNIRQAGGAINLIHKKRSGISMETAMILLELDRPLMLKENFSGYEICGYIPMQAGKVINIQLPKLNGTYHFDVRVSIGDVCTKPEAASDASVAFWGESNNLNYLLDDFHWLENNSIIRYQHPFDTI